MKNVTPFLMFQEQNAEEAMNFYTSLFDDASIEHIKRYEDGTVMEGFFTLSGQGFRCTDSPIEHNFAFTPSFSTFIDCETVAEFDKLYEALQENGEVLMPEGDYGFSPKFAWVNDRFGVSWQINLPKE
ncbi:VOC family protein [Salimicrobium flavidum]|uniref:Glyoxalase superfamily enzyme, possibly 3-demethylubiquinone-9 3-methyltransferase n=1 Tax=Salimicrobium flavidum TaxID=570947 RepID=A0A1N7J844_9BACI|nr:VOC family protein [Salimicrobium flavidum]SIS45490.1 Glyoxalase superfamily enzyme, possibly 3-demethylubiquinone-9 3-methyltransferase [Salimicrobium flavidum]